MPRVKDLSVCFRMQIFYHSFLKKQKQNHCAALAEIPLSDDFSPEKCMLYKGNQRDKENPDSIIQVAKMLSLELLKVG